MAVANVVLKDKSGNDVTYNKIQHIKVLEDSGAERTYTDMSTLRSYFCTYDENTKKFTIAAQWITVCGAGYAVSSPRDNYLAIVTSKQLTTGDSYYESELGGV